MVDLRGYVSSAPGPASGRSSDEGSGSVVNIATVHSDGLPGLRSAPYDAAKWGMVGLTKSLAVEYAFPAAFDSIVLARG